SCEGYRLPTEAEWEYFARAGSNFRYPGSILPTDVSWSKPKSVDQYHPVRQLVHNSWNIYDLSGNVWEWCWDYYGRYERASAVDPLGPQMGLEKIRRGGDYAVEQKHATVTRRSSKDPRNADWTGTGFRIVRTRIKSK
ncbi:MAG: hypothetical protein CMK59_10475, partial [Proteobacteria bacterium]|nr:hypothetical protein [Pseudomonadota bacterium]